MLCYCSVADPNQYDAGPDPNPPPHQNDANLRKWCTHLPGLHCERPRPSLAPFECPQLLKFEFVSDLYPTVDFDGDADPDPQVADRNTE
jgi:hypothetical protein